MAAQQALGLVPQLHQRWVVLAIEAPVGRQLQLVVAFVLRRGWLEESLGIANVNGYHHVETGRPFNDGIETRIIDGNELPIGVARTQTHGLEELDALGAVADLPLKSLASRAPQPGSVTPFS